MLTKRWIFLILSVFLFAQHGGLVMVYADSGEVLPGSGQVDTPGEDLSGEPIHGAIGSGSSDDELGGLGIDSSSGDLSSTQGGEDGDTAGQNSGSTGVSDGDILIDDQDQSSSGSVTDGGSDESDAGSGAVVFDDDINGSGGVEENSNDEITDKKPLEEGEEPLAMQRLGESLTPTKISLTTGGNRGNPNTWLGGVVPTSDDVVQIRGIVEVDANRSVAGLIVDEGAELRNSCNGSSTKLLTINGKLINRGMIRSCADVYRHSNYGYLNLNLDGDVENYGHIQHNTVRLIKQGIQHINGDGEMAATVIIASGTTIAGSLRILQTTYIGNSHNNRIGGGLQQNGEVFGIESTASVLVQGIAGTMTIQGGTIQVQQNINATITGSLEKIIFLSGVHEIQGNTLLNVGEVLLQPGAELRNTCNSSSTRLLTIRGKLINQGMIRSCADVYRHSNYGYLNLNLDGDVENYGHIQHNTVRLIKQGIQNIDGDGEMAATVIIASGTTIAGSLRILQTTYTGNSHGNNAGGALHQNGEVFGIEPTASVLIDYLRGSMTINEGTIQVQKNINATITGSLEKLVLLSGVHEIEGNTNLTVGELIIQSGAELRNTCNSSSTRLLMIRGKLINRGMIRSCADVYRHSNYGYLEPRIYGELINYGTIRHMSTRVFENYRGPGTTAHLTMMPAIVPVTGATQYRLNFITTTGLLVTGSSTTPEIILSNPNFQGQRSISAYSGNTLLATSQTRAFGLPYVGGSSSLPSASSTTLPLPRGALNAGSFGVDGGLPAQSSSYLSMVGNMIGQGIASINNTITQIVGDPVNLAKGEFQYSNTLLTLPGKGMDYTFGITYHHQLAYTGSLGRNMEHNYAISLTQLSGSDDLMYHDGKLGIFRFAGDGSGAYLYNPGVRANVALSGDRYVMTFVDGSSKKFALTHGKIVSWIDRHDNTLTFGYDFSNRLTTVTDTLGRQITYGYDSNSKLTNVRDPYGKEVRLSYFSQTDTMGVAGSLQTIEVGTEGLWRSARFAYEDDGSNPMRAMTHLWDANNQLYVLNTYNAANHIISQQYGDGTLQYAYVMSGVGDSEYISQVTTITRKGDTVMTSYRPDGQILTITHGDRVTRYQYNEQGLPTLITKPGGNGVWSVYDDYGNIIEQRNLGSVRLRRNGTVITGSADLVSSAVYNSGTSLVTRQVATDGIITDYTRDTDDNIIQTTQTATKGTTTLTRSTMMSYDAYGRLLTQTDPTGLTTTWTYNDQGQIVSKTIGDRTQQFAYDDRGRMIRMRDPLDQLTTMTYDIHGNLLTRTTPGGVVDTFTYDANGNLLTQTRPLDDLMTAETMYGYDSLDRPLWIDRVVSSGQTIRTTQTFDPNGNMLTMASPDRASTTMTYDMRDQAVTTTIGSTDGPVQTAISYDLNGNVTSTTTADGSVTSMSYDGYDRMVTSTDPLGIVTKITYDKAKRPLTRTTTNASGDIVGKMVRAYDVLGRPIRETQTRRIGDTPAGYEFGSKSFVTTTTYDLADRVLTRKTSSHTLQTLTYDTNGRVATQTDNIGTVTSYTYDANDRITQTITTDPAGKQAITTSTYDPDGRVLTQTDHRGSTTTMTYDRGGRMISRVSPDGQTESRVYDALDRMTMSRLGDQVKYYSYNNANDLLSLTDHRNQVTTWTYNDRGLQTSQTYPDASTQTTSYDLMGRPHTETDAKGTVMAHNYDALGRLTQTTVTPDAETSYQINRTYDTNGNLITLNDTKRGTIQREYDMMGNIIAEIASGVKTIQRRNATPAPIGLIFADETQMQYGYDALGRIKSSQYGQPYRSGTKKLWEWKESVSRIYSGSLLTNQTYPGGNRSYLEYDANRDLTDSTIRKGKPFATRSRITHQQTWNYDASARIVGVNSGTYSYDQHNQVITSDQQAWNYDLAGNRTDLGSVNSVNQYTNNTYDANGALTQDSRFVYVYDDRDALLAVKTLTGSTIAQYEYDAIGRKVKKIANGSETVYTRFGRQMLSEMQNGEKIVYHQTPGLDQVVQVVRDSGTYWTIRDQIGSVVGVMNASGNIVQSYRYDLWGNGEVQDGTGIWKTFDGYTGVIIAGSALWTSREYDKDIGKYYLRNRRYDPSTSRFLTRDPLGYADDVNMYRYVANSPLMYTDPMGTDKVLTRVGGARDMLLGGMQMAGGLAQVLGAGALCKTVVLCGAGIALGANGVNDIVAGFSFSADGGLRSMAGERHVNIAIDPLNSLLDATVGEGYAKMGIMVALNLDPAGFSKGVTKMGLANVPVSGPYNQTKKINRNLGIENHHIPSQDALKKNGIDPNKGFTVPLSRTNHQKTRSWGNGQNAAEYRQQQSSAIQGGNMNQAIQMDIDDLSKIDPSAAQEAKKAFGFWQ